VSAASDEVTSLSATVPASAGGIAFTTTHWSVVLEAQKRIADSTGGLGKSLPHLLAAHL